MKRSTAIAVGAVVLIGAVAWGSSRKSEPTTSSRPLPPKPTRDPSPSTSTVASGPDSSGAPSPHPSPSSNARGLRLSPDGTSIDVVDLTTWVAYAAPWLEDNAGDYENAADAVGALVSTLWPDELELEGLRISGAPAVDRIDAATKAGLGALVTGQAPASSVHQPGTAPVVADRIAAVLVGTSPLPHQGPAFAYRGFDVRLVNAGAAVEWKAWLGGREGGTAPDLQGTKPGLTAAVTAARGEIDEILEDT
jgi:hypothetical protein